MCVLLLLQLCGPQMMGVITSASAVRPLNRPILPSAPLRTTHCSRFGRKRQFEGQHMAGYVKLHPVLMQVVFAGMRPHYALGKWYSHTYILMYIPTNESSCAVPGRV